MVMTTREAADYLRCSSDRLRRIAKEGLIPCRRLGDGPRARYTFVKEKLDLWLMQDLPFINPLRLPKIKRTSLESSQVQLLNLLTAHRAEGRGVMLKAIKTDTGLAIINTERIIACEPSENGWAIHLAGTNEDRKFVYIIPQGEFREFINELRRDKLSDTATLNLVEAGNEKDDKRTHDKSQYY